MAYCSSCGAPVPDGAEFCPSCGMRLPLPATVASAPPWPPAGNRSRYGFPLPPPASGPEPGERILGRFPSDREAMIRTSNTGAIIIIGVLAAIDAFLVALSVWGSRTPVSTTSGSLPVAAAVVTAFLVGVAALYALSRGPLRRDPPPETVVSDRWVRYVSAHPARDFLHPSAMPLEQVGSAVIDDSKFGDSAKLGTVSVYVLPQGVDHPFVDRGRGRGMVVPGVLAIHALHRPQAQQLVDLVNGQVRARDGPRPT